MSAQKEIAVLTISLVCHRKTDMISLYLDEAIEEEQTTNGIF